MKKRIHSLLAAFNLAILLALPAYGHAIAASAPRIYTQPASVTAHNGQNLNLPLRVAANGTTLNAVEVIVNFPSSQLSFDGLDKAGSFFDTVVPSSPTAKGDKLEFSVASLAGTTTNDELIGTLIFRAKTDSGTGKISFDGSAAANAGKVVAVTTTDANVTYAAANGNNSGVTISDVSVSDVTITGGTVRWHTDVATTGSVDYGSTTNYGFTAGNDTPSLDHSVALDSVFSGATAVHFNIVAVGANGASNSSGDKSFVTKGYNVAITVKNKNGKALAGAKVSVAGAAAVAADNNGVAHVQNVAPGNQKVVVSGGKEQFIVVKAVNGKAASDVQSFTLQADRNVAAVWALALVIALAAGLLIVWLWHQRARKAQPSK